MSADQQSFYVLIVALAIGLLIGVERGWKERDAGEGGRVAGVRTYGLIGLLGGVAGQLSVQLGPQYGAWLIGFVFLGLCTAFTVSYALNLADEEDIGITSLIAALLTFVLGALAGLGEVAVAGAFGVVTTLLLSYKPPLHRFVAALERTELQAGLKLLLISVVLLPVLPNRGYGPFQALNPYVIWWMVVLIAAISFIGYFAIKIGGARRGAIFTGLSGGLVSSTAVTLHFSRLVRRDNGLAPAMAMGILIACGTMLPRMLIVAGIINPHLFKTMLVPALAMMLVLLLAVLLNWRSVRGDNIDLQSSFKNPLELGAALTFGIVLAVVLLLGKLLRNWFGDAGVLALAAASGITDVDAINLSLARMSLSDLDLRTALTGVVIAAGVNSLTKGIMAVIVGGGALLWRVGLPLALSAVAGFVAVSL